MKSTENTTKVSTHRVSRYSEGMTTLIKPITPPTRIKTTPRLSRLSYLMGLYSENFVRFERLFALADAAEGMYASDVGDGLPLTITVDRQHKFTMELTLSYTMLDPHSGVPDPSAHLRLYRDSQQLEVTHCYVGKRWQDIIGLDAPGDVIFDHRMQMNVFLQKWLVYLSEQGHGAALPACR